eukprot:699090-Pyramimonas_sp.AAC.1
MNDDQKGVAREMTQRPYAAAYAGRRRGTPHWRRGSSRATLRGQLTRQCRRRRARFLASLACGHRE